MDERWCLPRRRPWDDTVFTRDFLRECSKKNLVGSRTGWEGNERRCHCSLHPGLIHGELLSVDYTLQMALTWGKRAGFSYSCPSQSLALRHFWSSESQQSTSPTLEKVPGVSPRQRAQGSQKWRKGWKGLCGEHWQCLLLQMAALWRWGFWSVRHPGLHRPHRQRGS